MSTEYEELLASGAHLLALDAEAVRTSIEIAERITVADLGRPTPCAGWTLRDLLEHNIAQHRGFAAASRGASDIADWKPTASGDDPVAEYKDAAAGVLAAFAADGVLERRFPLPEFGAGFVVPAPLAVSFHLVDYVVHSWDMAASLGIEVGFSDKLLQAALLIARAVPAGDSRTEPGASFAPVVAVETESILDQVLGLLGRSPDWKP